LIHITHWKKKYTRTAKAGGLNGLKSAKKRREEFTGIEEGFNILVHRPLTPIFHSLWKSLKSMKSCKKPCIDSHQPHDDSSIFFPRLNKLKSNLPTNRWLQSLTMLFHFIFKKIAGVNFESLRYCFHFMQCHQLTAPRKRRIYKKHHQSYTLQQTDLIANTWKEFRTPRAPPTSTSAMKRNKIQHFKKVYNKSKDIFLLKFSWKTCWRKVISPTFLQPCLSNL